MSWGGFISWEGLSSPHANPPASVPAYGRQALACILRQERPEALYLPYYICDSVYEAARFAEIPVKWYPITQDFTPELSEIKSREMILVVDYFGLIPEQYLQSLTNKFGDRLILDLTHNWFATPPKSIWAFSSTRKFFGVPDGSKIWIPTGKAFPLSATHNKPEYRHLLERIQGNPGEAYALYSASEASISCELQLQSHLTTAILKAVDYDSIQIRRKENFRLLSTALQPYNQLIIPSEFESTPFQYPFLPKAPLEHKALHQAGIFAPRLWAEVLTRNPEGYAFEKHLASNLLPLPVDQRYNQEDMHHMLEVLKGLML